MSATRLPEAAADLDWEEFVSAYFPETRRHNLQALVAYGAYKRSRIHRASNGDGERAENGAAERTALQGWEDEGGRTL
jgi:hypothetical protein